MVEKKTYDELMLILVHIFDYKDIKELYKTKMKELFKQHNSSI